MKCLCGDTIGGTKINATGIHALSDISAVAATCIKAGHTEGKKCANCTYNTSTKIPALGHAPSDRFTLQSCGCTTNTCETCGIILTRNSNQCTEGHKTLG